MGDTDAAPDRNVDDGFERPARRQENAPAAQFLHNHLRQCIGPAQGLRRRRQPAGQRPHVRRRERAHLYPLEKQGEVFSACLRAFEISIDLAMIDADLPRQEPQNAWRQFLTIRERSAWKSQYRQNAGQSQPVRCTVLPHDQIEIRLVQRVVLGDLPFVIRDRCRLAPPCFAQQCTSRHSSSSISSRGLQRNGKCVSGKRPFHGIHSFCPQTLPFDGKSDIVRIQ